MAEFKDRLKYPFSNPRRLLLGAFLAIIPVLNLVSFGYVLKAARALHEGQNTLPEWKGIISLFLKGFLGVLLPAVLTFIIWIPLFRIITSLVAIHTIVRFVVITLAIVIGLIYIHVLLSLLLIYAITNKFTEALQPWKYYHNMFSKKFLEQSFFGILIFLLYMLIAGSILTVISPYFSSPLIFIALLTYFSMAATSFEITPAEAPKTK